MFGQLAEVCSLKWGVQFHPFATPPSIPQFFSTFTPSCGFGQTIGPSYGLGHLSGNVFMAPQGMVMGSVVSECKPALQGSRKPCNLVICCLLREAGLMGFAPGDSLGSVRLRACTLYQLLGN